MTVHKGVAISPLLLSPPGDLTIRFLDVGRGDAVMITAPDGQTLLYDGGRSESRMRELIRQFKVGRVDVVVASHADADNITGLIPVTALLRPKFFINNGLAGTTQGWERLVNVLSLAGTQGVKAQDQVLNLGKVKVTVLAPPPGMPQDEQNVNSVGLLVEYAGFRALMTGDSEHVETQGWLRKYPASFLGPVDVCKAIHHGSLNGDTLAWLRAVQPRNVVIGVGPNTYGHPTNQALTLYRLVGASTFRTDVNGTVTVRVQANGRYTVMPERGTFLPGRATPSSAAPPSSPPPAPVSPPVYFWSCAEARAAGVTPLLRGQPGYPPGLDGDGDGRACE